LANIRNAGTVTWVVVDAAHAVEAPKKSTATAEKPKIFFFFIVTSHRD
jgi:hypothetical protein